MNDAELRRIYQEGLTTRDAPGCPEPEALRDLVTGVLVRDERLALMDHVMACPTCRREYDLLRSFHEARPPASHMPYRMLALAASLAAVLGATVFLTVQRPEPDVTRGGETAVRLVAPVSTVAASGLELSWQPLSGEVRYTVEVIDSVGATVFSTVTRRSSVVLPDSVRLVPALDYRWWVRAVRDDGSELRSEFQAFRVR